MITTRNVPNDIKVNIQDVFKKLPDKLEKEDVVSQEQR